MGWNLHAYGSDNNFLDFLDKISAAEAEILYGDKTIAELSPEALDVVASSASFAAGETIVVFNQDQGHWEEISIQQAAYFSEELASFKSTCMRNVGAASFMGVLTALFMGALSGGGGTPSMLFGIVVLAAVGGGVAYVSSTSMGNCIEGTVNILADEAYHQSQLGN